MAEAARREAYFLEVGKTALTAGRSGPSTREEQPEAEVADLTQALGDAHVELRVWKKSTEGRLGPHGRDIRTHRPPAACTRRQPMS